jgi:hypothetical protein
MNKLILTLSLLGLVVMSFAQRPHEHHPRQHEPRHEQRAERKENRRERENFNRSREYREFKFSRFSGEHFHNLRHYISLHREYSRFVYHNFELFDCNWYSPVWVLRGYPNYYSPFERRCIFPGEHIVWYEVPNFDGITLEMIDPDDVLILDSGDWMYLRDYYTIYFKINF